MMKKLFLILVTIFMTSSYSTGVLSAEIKDYENLIAASSGKEPVELFSGTWMVGEDIDLGRYEITTTNGQSGNIFIKKDGSSSYVNDILGDSSHSVDRISIYLTGGEEIEIIGIDPVIFTPIEAGKDLTEIHSGNWIVGLDVEPGTYIATTIPGDSGNLFVHDENGRTVVNEILGTTEFGSGVERVQLKLKEGYEIHIMSLKQVNLEKR